MPGRDIDFIFSLGYRADVFYNYRKNYTKILHLATLLVMHNFKVVIVGPGWKTLKEKFDKRIDKNY